MKNFDSRVYNIGDFIEWRDNDLLDLSPDFQRRSVWAEKAKSYLIDTIIRGKPMPKILITQELKARRQVRIVIDGQQRLRAILEYYDNGFKISRAHNQEYAGYLFDDLPESMQNEIFKYEIGVDVLYDTPYRDLLDIFARINTYTVKLNKQESLNAKYVGFFKQTAFSLGFEYVDYFTQGNVVSRAQVTRMAEAELSSDLLVALIDGVQTNKSIEHFFRAYEDEVFDTEAYADRFHAVMSSLASIYGPKDLARTNWRRYHLFYTLFTAVAHAIYGLEGLDDAPRPRARKGDMAHWRVKLDAVSDKFDRYTDRAYEGQVPESYRKFIEYSRRGTTDTGARRFRTEFVCRAVVEDEN